MFWQARERRPGTAAVLVLLISMCPWPAAAGNRDGMTAEVPPAAAVAGKIVNYQRAAPGVATSGRLRDGAVDALKQLGFAAVVDLRTPAEGTADERRRVRDAGLRYFNIPVGRNGPGQSQLRQVKTLLADPGNYPVILHCGSGSRVGALWTLLRMDQGKSFEAAAAEGRAIGMKPGLEDKLRRRFQTLR